METDGKKYESVLQKPGLIKQCNDIGDESATRQFEQLNSGDPGHRNNHDRLKKYLPVRR